MRIIAGRLKRRSITIPRNLRVRPTTDRTREALFSLVEARMNLADARILDLFAGSGALGFEALSRGARAATFVEVDRQVCRVLRRNIERLEVEAESSLIVGDGVGYLRRYAGEPYDCIFADPPYRMAAIGELPRLALPIVARGGLFVLEHDRRIRFDTETSPITTRSYGRSTLSLFEPA